MIETKPFDAAEYLSSEEDIVAYLNAAMEDGNPGLVQAALGDVARARGMTAVARQSGLGRESLYKALRPGSSPSFITVRKVAEALGARITFTPAVPA